MHVSFPKARHGNQVDQWYPTLQLEPLTTEFELKGLDADTDYLIVVRLLNEAGVGEQKLQKRTSKSRIGK